MIRDLSHFKNELTFSARTRLVFWRVVQDLLFSSILCPNILRIQVLRFFGASISSTVKFKSGVKIHDPKNLTIGDNCWIGEKTWFINHAMITLNDNICISQAAILCSSGHNLKDSSLSYKHESITIKSGAWIALRATILPGSKIGTNSVVSAGEVFSGILEDEKIFISGEPYVIFKS